MPGFALDDRSRSAAETNSASDSNFRHWAPNIDLWVASLLKVFVVAFANEVEPGGIVWYALQGDRMLSGDGANIYLKVNGRIVSGKMYRSSARMVYDS